MRPNGMKLFLAVLLAIGGQAGVAHAEEPAAASPEAPILRPAQAFPWFVALGGGAGYATISHPQIVAGGSAVPVLTLYGGYTFGDHLSIGVDFSSVETKIGRDSGREPFQIGYSPQPQAIWQFLVCNPCDPKPRGSEVVETSLVFSSVGARAEYAPFGRDGLFVGGGAGLAFQIGLKDELGLGLNGRVGYRYRATNILTVSIEAGVSGQIYGDTTMYMPFGVAVVRPYFLSGVRSYPKKPRTAPPQ